MQQELAAMFVVLPKLLLKRGASLFLKHPGLCAQKMRPPSLRWIVWGQRIKKRTSLP